MQKIYLYTIYTRITHELRTLLEIAISNLSDSVWQIGVVALILALFIESAHNWSHSV